MNAAHMAVGARLPRRRGITGGFFIGAARREQAAGGAVVLAGHHAGQAVQAALAERQFGNGLQSSFGVGMRGGLENGGHGAGFHHLAGIHHRHIARVFGHQPQIVGDQHHGHFFFALQAVQ